MLMCEKSKKTRLWALIKPIIEGFFIGMGLILAFEIVRGWL